MLRNFGQIGRSIEEDGKYHYAYVHKPTVPTHSNAGRFIDLNQSAGTPKYNPFVGAELTSTRLIGGGNAGIYPGNFISGSSKHLARFQMVNLSATTSAPPDNCYLNDYLMFYPLIDCDNLDQQDMINTVTLPRYQDAIGVRIVLIATAPMSTAASLTINYTNELGVSGRSVTATVIAAPNIGVCATVGGGTSGAVAQASPFFPLAENDLGVSRIDSVQFNEGAGGFMCLALVMPIATLPLLETAVACEKVFGINHQRLPEIYEGAYLNLMIARGNNGNGNYRAELIFINS